MLVSSGMWEDLFQEDFYQCTDIKLTQIKQCKCKQGLIRLKLLHSNSSWPGIPEMYALDHKSYFLKSSLQFLPCFEEKLQTTSDKRLPTQGELNLDQTGLCHWRLKFITLFCSGKTQNEYLALELPLLP